MIEMKTTVQVRLYPTPEQATLLRAHCPEYISAINVLTQALDCGVLPDGGKGASTKDFTAALPSAVKNQALRDAHSVWQRSFEFGRIPLRRKPICQWNNQNWRIESQTVTEGAALLIPLYRTGQVQQASVRCAALIERGTPGLRRIKRKRGKWMAEIAFTLPAPEPTIEQGIMGVDLGVTIPAVIHVVGKGAKGTRYLGHGRSQRMMRRRFFARRKRLQRAGKIRAVRKSRGTERRWMRDLNHKLSRQMVSHARSQGVGIIRWGQLAGMRQRTYQRTARTSRGAQARTNNRMIAT
jgi:transposase